MGWGSRGLGKRLDVNPLQALALLPGPTAGFGSSVLHHAPPFLELYQESFRLCTVCFFNKYLVNV